MDFSSEKSKEVKRLREKKGGISVENLGELEGR